MMKGINMKDYTETIIKTIEESCKAYNAERGFTIKAVNTDSVELQWSRNRKNDELAILGVNDAGQVYITINDDSSVEHTIRVDVEDSIFCEAATIEEGIYIAIHDAMRYPKHCSRVYNNIWYAVIHDNNANDYWDRFHYLDEAKAWASICRDTGEPDAYIAVIKLCDTPIRIDEIREF